MVLNKSKKASKNEEDLIRITESNIEEYGFVRFCYPEEKEKILQQGYRMVNFGFNTDGSNESRKILIPQKYLIPLSRVKPGNLVNRPNYGIMEVGDQFGQLKLLSKRAGWNQTDQDLIELKNLAGRSYYLASILENDHEIPLGSGAVIYPGEDISWISMILVHEEVRRQGIAASLMFHCLLSARAEGKYRVIGLDATPKGKTLYIQTGFKKSFSIWRCLVPTKLVSRNIGEFSSESCNDIDTIRDYLLQKGFGEREKLFRSLLNISGGSNIITRKGSRITGLVLSRPGARRPYVGPLIADDEKEAERLLFKVLNYWKKQNIEQVFMDVPSIRLLTGTNGNDNDDAELISPFIINDGFLRGGKVLRTFDRMYHLVSLENKKAVLDFFTSNFAHENEILNLLERSEKSFTKTESYLENILILIHGSL
jgi:GNAT superfamily N-acetyltransferase